MFVHASLQYIIQPVHTLYTVIVMNYVLYNQYISIIIMMNRVPKVMYPDKTMHTSQLVHSILVQCVNLRPRPLCHAHHSASVCSGPSPLAPTSQLSHECTEYQL